ncbi:MAG: hypothetical protein PHC66_02670 [Candidatus Nanoarchaeia archaeon]|nr:hypothetical protein [Candidatus Nanoarchaeia archaeon]MDD5239673.1 hypothetical protein [Candidatus Nanoarchaeia archaeon]
MFIYTLTFVALGGVLGYKMINPTDVLEAGYSMAKPADLCYLADRTVDYVRNIDLGSILDNMRNDTVQEEADKLLDDVCSLTCCCVSSVVVGVGVLILAYQFLRYMTDDHELDVKVTYKPQDNNGEKKKYKSNKPKCKK